MSDTSRLPSRSASVKAFFSMGREVQRFSRMAVEVPRGGVGY